MPIAYTGLLGEGVFMIFVIHEQKKKQTKKTCHMTLDITTKLIKVDNCFTGCQGKTESLYQGKHQVWPTV